MIEIECYLNDGVCAQSQAVLAFLRDNYYAALHNTWDKEQHEYIGSFCVGRYENQREQGYVFSVRYKYLQLNFAVYEHRNSAELCVVKFERFTQDTPTAEIVKQNMKDKYDVSAKFEYFDIKGCGRYIVESINEFINNINLKEERE